jgi:hypothetical protein
VVICHHGQPANSLIRDGLDELAVVCERLGSFRVAVDDNVPFARLTHPNFPRPDLVYCATHAAADLLDDSFRHIRDYLRNSGAVLIEASPEGEPGAEIVIRKQFEAEGVEFRELDAGQDLMRRPYLFAKAPDGYAENRQAVLVAWPPDGGCVLLSSKCYAAMWAGLGPGRLPSREEIRAAHEFGTNIIAFARSRTAGAHTAGNLQP